MAWEYSSLKAGKDSAKAVPANWHPEELMRNYAFISYSHFDKAYAHRLAIAMQAAGIDAWLDDRIDYGTQWPREIQPRLEGCSAFVLVMSPNSLRSDWVQNELAHAPEVGKKYSHSYWTAQQLGCPSRPCNMLTFEEIFYVYRRCIAVLRKHGQCLTLSCLDRKWE
jgi:hypothetical protein